MTRIDAIRTTDTEDGLKGIEWLVEAGITAPLDAEERAALALRRAEIGRGQAKRSG